MTDEEGLIKIKSNIERGRTGTFSELAEWIKRAMPHMSLGVWSELRALLHDTYDVSDEDLAKVFASPAAIDESDDFTPLVEELGLTGWLRDGMEFTSDMEAPNAFGFWSFLTLLAASLKRQCYVDMGYFKIWPAMQTMLVGPSQRVRKSTIGNYIVELGDESERVTRLMEEGSQEALKMELQEMSDKLGYAAGLLFVSEMATLFGEKDYNKDLVKNLTDLFDSRNYLKRKTITHGEQIIRNMAISALMCTNERWLREGIPQSAYEGGFMARCIIVHCSGTDKRVPIPKLANPDKRNELINWLKRTQFIEGAAVLSDSAEKYYVERYNQLKDTWPEDTKLHPFWNKYPVHMLKIAMLLSVSKDVGQRSGLTISDRDMYQADRLLGWSADKLPALYRQLGTTEHGDLSIEVINFIKGKGGTCEEVALGRAMLRRMPKYKLTEILTTFSEYGMISRGKSKRLGGGRTITLLNTEGV